MLVVCFFNLKVRIKMSEVEVSKEKGTRAVVSLENFLRVTVAQREVYNTVEKAAAELGMTPSSFKQRMTRERKQYPAIYENVPKYTDSSGPRRASQDEALALLAKLQAPQDNAGDEESQLSE